MISVRSLLKLVTNTTSFQVIRVIIMITLLLSRGANSGPIVRNGTTALQLAKDAVAGEFEEYDDMPSRTEYSEVVNLLQRLRAD